MLLVPCHDGWIDENDSKQVTVVRSPWEFDLRSKIYHASELGSLSCWEYLQNATLLFEMDLRRGRLIRWTNFEGQVAISHSNTDLTFKSYQKPDECQHQMKKETKNCSPNPIGPTLRSSKPAKSYYYHWQTPKVQNAIQEDKLTLCHKPHQFFHIWAMEPYACQNWSYEVCQILWPCYRGVANPETIWWKSLVEQSKKWGAQQFWTKRSGCDVSINQQNIHRKHY